MFLPAGPHTGDGDNGGTTIIWYSAATSVAHQDLGVTKTIARRGKSMSRGFAITHVTMPCSQRLVTSVPKGGWADRIGRRQTTISAN